jgi:hypothetical protein
LAAPVFLNDFFSLSQKEEEEERKQEHCCPCQEKSGGRCSLLFCLKKEPGRLAEDVLFFILPKKGACLTVTGHPEGKVETTFAQWPLPPPPCWLSVGGQRWVGVGFSFFFATSHHLTATLSVDTAHATPPHHTANRVA